MGTGNFIDAPRRAVGAVPFTVMPFSQVVREVMELGMENLESGVAIHFANAYNVALAESDPSYRSLLEGGHAVFSDGVPVVWAGKRLHPTVAESWTRVYGPDVMTAVLDRSSILGPRHYLLGGTPETLAVLQASIQLRWPDAVIVGAESPVFGTWSEEEISARNARIEMSGATVVWVGLGTPKQDWEANRIAQSLPVVALAVGAAFDFLAGTKRQAPVWLQRLGLEWSYRLVHEPRRLARRYVWGNPTFIRSVLRHGRTQSTSIS